MHEGLESQFFLKIYKENEFQDGVGHSLVSINTKRCWKKLKDYDT
jgi:hypothetical protein